MTKNLYKIVTSWDGSPNFNHYYVTASSGYVAAAWLQSQVLYSKKRKKQREHIDEIELVGPIEHEVKE